MKSSEVIEKIKVKFSSDIISENIEVVQPFVIVNSSKIYDVIEYLKNDSFLKFDFLRCLCGVDDNEKFTIVYHLFSYEFRHEITVKTQVPRQMPELKTISSLYAVADWYERETFDLMGINFLGHRDLRRIMLPDDWEGHPLRKDYVEPAQYNGIPCTRKS